MDSNRGIGKSGGLAWRLKGDMDHFRSLTQATGDRAVIMGRTTWESLPEKFRPLPGRLNIVLSRQRISLPPAVLLAASLDEALNLPQVGGLKEVFVIGGAQVYSQAVVHKLCNKIYLTEIKGNFDCDTFFPEIPPDFKRINESDPINEGGVIYNFVIYER